VAEAGHAVDRDQVIRIQAMSQAQSEYGCAQRQPVDGHRDYPKSYDLQNHHTRF